MTAVTETPHARDPLVHPAPLDFQPSSQRSFEPDLLVVRRDAIGRKNVATPPVLIVEVLSPSTRSLDELLKREMYQSSGVPAYRIVDPGDPEATRPKPATFAAHELADGVYRQVAKATAGERATVEKPCPVTVCPDDLARG